MDIIPAGWQVWRSSRHEYSELAAREVDEEIRAILDAAYDRASESIRSHQYGLNGIAASLLEREEMPGKDVYEFLACIRSSSGPSAHTT